MRAGFLNENPTTLYPSSGSGECSLSDEQKQKQQENERNHIANKSIDEMMNRGGGDTAPWYTSNFPKGCQYNSPGCDMSEIGKSSHSTGMHRELLTRSDRWLNIIEGPCDLKEIRLLYSSLKDTDLPELINAIKEKHNLTLEILDLSCNELNDFGAQIIAGALATNLAPNLKVLRVFGNKFTKLGKVVLDGLKLLRKCLLIELEKPVYI